MTGENLFFFLFLALQNIATHHKGADTKYKQKEDNGQDIDCFFHRYPKRKEEPKQ